MTIQDFSEFSWDEKEDVKAVLANRALEPRDFEATDNDNVPAGANNETIRHAAFPRRYHDRRRAIADDVGQCPAFGHEAIDAENEHPR